MNPAPSGTPGTDLRPVTLLVVEDEVLVRLVIADTFRDHGFHVLEAANADEARTLLSSFSDIRVVFTDVQMPGSMDGIALTRFIRSNYPSLTVIMTSGARTRPDDLPVAFVPKPYSPDDIVQRVEALLAADNAGSTPFPR